MGSLAKCFYIFINVFGIGLDKVFSHMSVAFTLEVDININRGDMIVKRNNRPKALQEFDAMLCWFNNAPARLRANIHDYSYLERTKDNDKKCSFKIDINTYACEEDDKDLKMNVIARIMMIDEYRDDRVAESFVIIDQAILETVAAGMII